MYIQKSYHSEKAEAVGFYSLRNREIRPDRNWHELMIAWEQAKTIREMDSILHYGYDVSMEKASWEEPEYELADRHIFYLQIANGWADSLSFHLAEDCDKEYYDGSRDQHGNLKKKTPGDSRAQLARKAFDMLCLNFFKTTELTENQHSRVFRREWIEIVTSPRLFPVIQNFFRIKEDLHGDKEVYNLHQNDRRSHNEEHAVNFLLNLAKFMWRWRGELITSWYDDQRREITANANAKMNSRLNAAKPWMVVILCKLDKLDILREFILHLEKPVLDKLKEIALSNKFNQYQNPVREARPVANLDEARYLSSKTAWFLAEHELKIREHKRLERIQKEKLKIAEADREIRKLAAKR